MSKYLPTFRALRPISVTLIATAALLGGCGTNPVATGVCRGSNFDEVQMAPGCSTVCAEEPCKVFFAMPAGEGEYEVRGRGVSIGRYPAGKTVFLGSFWHGSHRITVEGTDAPPAYLYIGGSRGDAMGF